MEIACPACDARYRVPDSEIPASGRALRCSACNAEWTMRPPRPQPAQEVAPAPNPMPAAGAAPAAPIPRRPRMREAPKPEKSGGVFMFGFVLAALLLAAALGLYLQHEAVAAALPDFAPQIAQYVEGVDRVRELLDGLFAVALREFQALTGG